MNNMIKWLVDNSDLCMAITSICSIIIAVFALLLSFFSLCSQINFNKKSVKPVCYIEVGDYEDDLYVLITNVGLGIMFINTINCVDHNTGRKDNILINLLPDVDQDWEDFSGLLDKSPLAVGDEIYLMKISPKNDWIRNYLRNSLKNICIYVEYSDLYDKNYTYSCDLSFFGRQH